MQKSLVFYFCYIDGWGFKRENQQQASTWTPHGLSVLVYSHATYNQFICSDGWLFIYNLLRSLLAFLNISVCINSMAWMQIISPRVGSFFFLFEFSLFFISTSRLVWLFQCSTTWLSHQGWIWSVLSLLMDSGASEVELRALLWMPQGAVVSWGLYVLSIFAFLFYAWLLSPVFCFWYLLACSGLGLFSPAT